MLICTECGKEVTSLHGVGYWIKGVEVERDQGGTNHVMKRERTGGIVCRPCIVDYKAGVIPGQIELIPWTAA